MSAPLHAETYGRAWVECDKDGGESFLVVEIDIACDICGEIQIHLAGHHLRALRDLLIAYIAEFPELTGSDDDVKTIGSLQWNTRRNPHPERN